MENYINYSYSNCYHFEGGGGPTSFRTFFDIFKLSSTPIVLPPLYAVQLHKNLILDLHNQWTLGDVLHATQYTFLQSEKFICSFYLFKWLGIRNLFRFVFSV